MSSESEVATPLIPKFIFRLVTQKEYDEVKITGQYPGSALDERDGYIHMSVAAEVAPTACKYYAGAKDLVVLIVDTDKLAAFTSSLKVKMEFVETRNAFFPHLFGGALPLSAIHLAKAVPLLEDGSGNFDIPAEVC